jgi:hypothetical protein
MRYARAGILLFATALVGSAVAQPTQAPPTVIRTVIAATKLPSVVRTPLYFRALHISVPARATTMLPAADGILYQISGSTEVSMGGETKSLQPGEGLFVLLIGPRH